MGGAGGLMVSALDSGVSVLGLCPGWGHCLGFLGKTLYSPSASFYPGGQMGTGNGLASHPWGVEILLCSRFRLLKPG